MRPSWGTLGGGRQRPRLGAACLIGVVLSCSSPTFAQQSPPAAAATSEASAPIDPERLTLAREMFTMMHLDTAMRGVFSNALNSMPVVAGNSQNSARAQQFIKSYSAAMDADFPNIVDDMAEVYARVFTVQELRDTLAFYRTPSGQAALNKMPIVMQQLMPLVMKTMPRVFAAAESDFCGREVCTEAERAVFKRMEGMGADRSAPAAAVR
jgi:hypothetical protein